MDKTRYKDLSADNKLEVLKRCIADFSKELDRYKYWRTGRLGYMYRMFHNTELTDKRISRDGSPDKATLFTKIKIKVDAFDKWLSTRRYFNDALTKRKLTNFLAEISNLIGDNETLSKQYQHGYGWLDYIAEGFQEYLLPIAKQYGIDIGVHEFNLHNRAPICTIL